MKNVFITLINKVINSVFQLMNDIENDISYSYLFRHQGIKIHIIELNWRS